MRKALVVGYGCGLGKCRHLFSTTIIAALLAMVISMIIDIDRPRRGLIQVNQSSMIRLQTSLKYPVSLANLCVSAL